MAGVETTKEIRKVYDKKVLPIIALSGDDEKKVKKPFLEAGANVFLTKPLIFKSLTETLTTFFKRSPWSKEKT